MHVGVDTECRGLGEPFAINVDTDDAGTGGFEQLDGDLSDHSKSNDNDAFAQRRLHPAHALKCNRAKRDGRSVTIANSLRHRDGKISWNADDLRVMRALRACTGNAVAE